MKKQENKRLWWCAAGLALVAAFVLLLVFGYGEASRKPLIVRYHLSLKGTEIGQPPLRVVFMTDTHAGMPDMPPDRLRGIVAQVNALRPDLVLLGGDYGKGAPFGIGTLPAEQAVEPLYGLRARLGVIAVLGNNDCADANGAPIAGLLARNGIRVLRNEVALLPGIAVLGVDDVIHCKGNMGPIKRDFERQVKALGQGRWRQPVVLLSHEPAFAAYAPDYVNLALAGHTHGGQIFPAITAPLIARYNKLSAARGAMMVKGRPLIISSGVGTNNLPFRIGVPPEIVLVILAAD